MGLAFEAEPWAEGVAPGSGTEAGSKPLPGPVGPVWAAQICTSNFASTDQSYLMGVTGAFPAVLDTAQVSWPTCSSTV